MMIELENKAQQNLVNTLKTRNHHDDNFVIIGGTGGCHNDNLWCR